VLTVLMSGLVVAILYFARDIFIPITLAVLLSFLLAPAVRWLRRLRMGRVVAVAVTVLAAFLAILGFAAIVTQEVSSLAQGLPEYRQNIEAKIHSLPGAIPGSGVMNRAAAILRDLRNELTRSETKSSAQTDGHPLVGTSTVEPTKPLPVEIKQPDLGTAADRPGHCRTIASTIGDGRAGDRLCHHDPARARGSAGPAASPRRSTRPATDDRGDG
jgi:hypothetical protein